MILRNFEHRDSKKALDFHELVLKDTGAFAPGPWNDDMGNIEEVYIKPGGIFIIAEESNAIIGIGALRILSHEKAEIKRMRVEPLLQRKGIGQKILDYLLFHAEEKGIKRVILDTTELQKSAQRFYLKNDFTEYGKSYWNGLKIFLFEKYL